MMIVALMVFSPTEMDGRRQNVFGLTTCSQRVFDSQAQNEREVNL